MMSEAEPGSFEQISQRFCDFIDKHTTATNLEYGLLRRGAYGLRGPRMKPGGIIVFSVENSPANMEEKAYSLSLKYDGIERNSITYSTFDQQFHMPDIDFSWRIFEMLIPYTSETVCDMVPSVLETLEQMEADDELVKIPPVILKLEEE